MLGETALCLALHTDQPRDRTLDTHRWPKTD
jgi:hypothetical protein